MPDVADSERLERMKQKSLCVCGCERQTQRRVFLMIHTQTTVYASLSTVLPTALTAAGRAGSRDKTAAASKAPEPTYN